jgi:hypothetical protein
MKWIAKTIIKLFKLEDWVLTNAVRELYNTIGKDDIFRKEDGIYWQGEKTMTGAELDHLQAEAKAMVDSKLWNTLKNDIQYQANKAMFIKAESEQDLIAGKLWLYTLDCIDKKLIELSNLRH